MKRAALSLVLVAVTLALPAAAHADGITATCTSQGATAPCSSNRWYTADVTVAFVLPAGSSDPLGCETQTVAADTPGLVITCTVSVSGTQCCRLDVMIKRDATPPTVAAITAARGPDANGWYNHAVGVTVTGNVDATSGLASCTSVTYSGPDSSSASVTGTCTDNAGNVSAPETLSFPYDATPPSISAAPARAPDANGWYNHPVGVTFQGSDAVSGVDGCTSASYSGPDSGSASLTGTCRDKAGNTGTASFGLRYDATPPTVTGATPDRQPDMNGWYNHRLVVTFSGADAASGVASCDAPSYTQPDAATATLTGRCRDNAGNVSAPGGFSFKFDSTPPKLSKLAAAPLDGSVAMTWSASSDVAEVTIVRTRAKVGKAVTLYAGKRMTAFTDRKVQNGASYAYTVTAQDAAGNAVSGRATAVPAAPLLAPRRAAQIGGGTTLRWRARRGAAYYNVQLWLRGRKILTTWPRGPHLRLPHLSPGPYVWFVWPGLGSRAKHRYGPLLGRSTFVVTR